MEKTIKIAVACHNAGGEADFHFFKLKTLDSYIQDGCYEDRAKEISHDEGYDGPYVIFDETCFAGRN